MLSGSIDSIRQFHPGDPDMEYLDEWRRKYPEEAKRAHSAIYSHLPDSTTVPGQIIVFGTAGDMEAGESLKTLFNDPGFFIAGVDPYSTEENQPAVISYWKKEGDQWTIQ